MGNKVLEICITNKDDILDNMRANDHFSPYMEHAIKIIEDMDLPNLTEIFDFDGHPNEGLVYSFEDNQENLLPHIGICLERITDFALDEFGWSYKTVYSMPIVIIPMDTDLSDIDTDAIKELDENDYWFQNSMAFNHYYGFK